MIFTENSTLLFIGDSVTDCGRARPVGEGDRLGFGYVALVNALLTANYPEKKIKVLNTGVSGDTIRHLNARWENDVVNLAPDFLSVYIGVNDVWRKFDTPQDPNAAVGIEEYEETYRKLLDNIPASVKKVILITPFLSETDKTEPMMALLLDYIEVVKKLAREKDLILIDLQSAFDSYISAGISPKVLAGDRVHPSVSGAMIIAKSFLDAVDNYGK